VVIAGAGDVGGRLAALLARRGDEVIALRRREVEPGPGTRALRADLATGAGLDRLPRSPEAVVFCAAPDERSETSYRALYLDGLRRLLDACDARRVLFVSSTAVYAEDAGEWVDEATPARPPAFNGRVLLEAEHALAPHAGGVVLRLSGIYGPGREAMLRRARMSEAGRPRWSNRIHAEDAASALAHLLGHPEPGRLYLGNDDRPVLEHEIVAWLRHQEGLPPLPVADQPECGRRVSNAHLRISGWAPRFPDFTSGYGPLLAAAGV
jgi:electron-transferring-flavoprotein dehydrogenase